MTERKPSATEPSLERNSWLRLQPESCTSVLDLYNMRDECLSLLDERRLVAMKLQGNIDQRYAALVQTHEDIDWLRRASGALRAFKFEINKLQETLGRINRAIKFREHIRGSGENRRQKLFMEVCAKRLPIELFNSLLTETDRIREERKEQHDAKMKGQENL